MPPRALSYKRSIYIEDTFFIFQKAIGQKSQSRKYLTEKIRASAQARGVKLREHSDIALLIDVLKKKDMELPDIDNLAKPILDALKGIAYHDDKQVRSLQINLLESYKDEIDGDIHLNYLPIYATWADAAKKDPVIFVSIGKVEKRGRKIDRFVETFNGPILLNLSLRSPDALDSIKNTIAQLNKLGLS
jgi:Holliday junction resolvase RusA-like endonuclease